MSQTEISKSGEVQVEISKSGVPRFGWDSYLEFGIHGH